MTYNVNGKAYTDHPLLDEIVYNCKLILDGIVIKNDELANDSETENSTKNAEVYITITEGNMSFDLFPFTEEIFYAYGGGYTRAQIVSFVDDKNNIPVEDRDSLLNFSINYFMTHFEEENNYYRALDGLPPYKTTAYYVYIDSSYIPANYRDIDFSKPIHELDDYVIAVLENNGKMAEIISEHKGSNYSYLRYLGGKKISIYKSRKASKWDILYIPSVETSVEDRFKELYLINREIYLKQTYQEAYAFSSDYYEQIMILMLLCQTFNDMVVDAPEYYIKRDIFDIRSVQYFLESYSVEFFKEIPLKYQIRIIKNLNKLVKYKSSNKNNSDILDIFDLKNTSIFKYYLYKKRLMDIEGNYIVSDKVEEKYDLEFIQCKMNDTYDNYIKDQLYRTPYDDIAYQDKYWDGEDTHDYIKQKHLERDFTIEPTKYMSIEYKISMEGYTFQSRYLLGMILDSNINMNDISIAIPSIQSSTLFKLSDLFIFLCLLTAGFDKCNSDIITPKEKTGDVGEFDKYFQIDGGTPFTNESEYDIVANDMAKYPNDSFWQLSGNAGDKLEYSEIKSKEEFSNWIKDHNPDLFVDNDYYIYGFNYNVDLAEISNVIGRRHSHFNFAKGFTLADLGVDTFIIPSNIDTIDDLISIYRNNKKCYDNLKHKIIYECNTYDDYILFKYVFNKLFTREFDYGRYTLSDGVTMASNLEELMQDRDFVLYSTYAKLMIESNNDTRQDNIRDIMNDVIGTLEYYLNGDDMEYLFSFTTVESFNSLVHYMYLMINFFKSYKVYFMEPFTTIIANDKMENDVSAKDTIAEKRINYIKSDSFIVSDLFTDKIVSLNKPDFYFLDIKENLLISSFFDKNTDDDYIYDGMYPDTDLEYKIANGGGSSDSSSVPFERLDAGRVIEDSSWIDVLDSGSPAEEDYYIIDGGNSYHENDWKTDYSASSFKYVVDGGSSKEIEPVIDIVDIVVPSIDDIANSPVPIVVFVGTEIRIYTTEATIVSITS